MQKREVVEIFGLLSVIGSLIFVGIEISQNTQAVRGATHQSVSDQISEYYLSIAMCFMGIILIQRNADNKLDYIIPSIINPSRA